MFVLRYIQITSILFFNRYKKSIFGDLFKRVDDLTFLSKTLDFLDLF